MNLDCRRRLALSLFACLCVNVWAADFPPSAVPEPLKTWVPWVLDDVPDAGCPHLFSAAEPRQCAWPGMLEVKAERKGGAFAQDWHVYRESWVGLPGDERNWPQAVQVDGKPAAVIGRDGVPSVRLPAGNHRLGGRFTWNEFPESLVLPESAALLRLDIEGKSVAGPVRDEHNRLWLQGKVDSEGGEEAQIQVYRKIDDGVPIEVATRIRLEVSGKARELVVQRALLADTVPKELVSPLPATLTADGSLKVQARAGTWDITLVARLPGAVKAMRLPPLTEEKTRQGLAADEEVWVYQAAPAIRSASIEGAPPVDPQQTTLPPEWRKLPSYLMRADGVFAFKEIRRGDSDPAPDRLTLQRRVWLSFDGGTLTFNDRLQGEISRVSRLEMGGPAKLGRVDIDGQEQLITRGADALSGVEIKRGRLSLGADSEVPGAPRRLAAVGWKHDVERLAIDLELPAGWRLLHAGGADSASGAWLGQWNLLDFFLVMLTALAAGRLWGVRWGLIALLAMALAYQEPGAPTWGWLLLLAAVAIHRVLPAGRVKNAMNFVRRAGALLLALNLLAFATDQLRTAIYPVLENSGVAGSPVAYFAETPNPPWAMADAQTESPQPVAPSRLAGVAQEDITYAASPKSLARAPIASSQVKVAGQVKRQRAYQVVDPEAKVQTGPGLPDWRWHTHRLAWNGPVGEEQTLDLWLLSPLSNKLVVLLRLVLLGLFLVCAADLARPGGCCGERSLWRAGWSAGKKENAGAASGKRALIGLLLAVALAATGGLKPAHAALPTSEQLDALRDKLTRPAECLPECADISRLSVQLVGGALRLGLDVEAARDVALPLPGGAKYWLPSEASVDGKPAHVRRSAEDGGDSPWLLVPAGRHRVELHGPLSARDLVQLPLPLKPRRLDVQAEGWEVVGVSEESGAADTLQLSRRVKQSDPRVGQDVAAALPPFLRVERRLILDLLWRVETTVRRDSPSGVPAVVQIPLLPGESVTTQGIVVKDGKAFVNLGPQADSIGWSSSLAQRGDLTLVAPETGDWAESWAISASALWHVDAQGIAPIAAAAGDDLVFRPWPGETLKLNIARPQPVPGQTLTIDKSTLTVSAGTRSSDYHLNLAVRGSRGVDHVVSLPAGAILQRVAINGETRPIRLSGDEARKLSLPLTPGRQSIDILWRLDQEMTTRYATSGVDLGQASVNQRTSLKLPQDRWLLFAAGPGIGPAILFWGKLLVLLVVAVAVGYFSARHANWPMRRTWQWLLLALGLTQTPWWATAVVVAWFLALAWRAEWSAKPDEPAARPSNGRLASFSHWPFNLRQIGFVLLTLVMLGVLFAAVESGLLGHPDMQVAGNASSAWQLNWYLDRAEATLSGVWVLTLPIFAYRALMLFWALWLAWSLLAWLKWGWNAFAAGGLWRRRPKISA